MDLNLSFPNEPVKTRPPPSFHYQVTITGGGIFLSNPLFLRSNLTLFIDEGTTLQALDVGGNKADDIPWPWLYVRRESTMKWAYAGFLNGAKCIKFKDPLVGWDDCAAWSKLENVVLEGGGTIDGDGDAWIASDLGNTRPYLLDLMWVDGLTIRNLKLRRPGMWTTVPTFSNNVRVEGNDIYTRGSNTDGVDPESSWNVYIANNTIDTGDDCKLLICSYFFCCETCK
jgi:polygalacturonase